MLSTNGAVVPEDTGVSLRVADVVSLGSGAMPLPVDLGPIVLGASGPWCLQALNSGPLQDCGGGLFLIEDERQLMGALCVDTGPGLREQSRSAYARLLELCREWTLYRLWNFLPGINDCPTGEENYRLFCEGRSLAFEQCYGNGKERHMPAASCVGSQGRQLIVLFVAGREPAIHIENPLQVPAYAYPRQYGKRSPSFARATLVRGGGRGSAFISGTAAIRGHTSVGHGDLGAQLDVTLENITTLLQLFPRHGFDVLQAQRHVVAYLRHRSSLTEVRAALQETLVRPQDALLCLQADICRSELDVEIEVTLTQANGC